MKIDSIDSFDVTRNQKFFFDSNVWLYLLYPQDNQSANRWITKYSKFNDLVLRRDSLILTNLIQMSELINVIVQKEYKRYCQSIKPNYINFKEYRDSEEGLNTLGKAKTFTAQIMKQTTLQTGLFNSEDMKAIVADCDKADFNDIYFARFCQKQSCIMVTHDYDFRALGTLDVQLLTANGAYLH